MKKFSLSALLRRLPVLYEGQTLESLPQHLVGFLSRTVDSDALAYHEVDLRRATTKMVINRKELINSPLVGVFASLMHHHPVIRHQRQTGDLSAHKISDFLSRPQFHDSALYQEVYRAIRAEDQFAFSLNFAPGNLVAIALNRSRRNFTEADRQLLNCLQPHLTQVYRNAVAMSGMHAELRALRNLVHKSTALIILDLHRRPQFVSEPALRLLKKYFPKMSAYRAKLPEALTTWLYRSSQVDGIALPGCTDAFCRHTPGGTLIVQWVKPDDQTAFMLRLEEHNAPLSAKPLEGLNLTPRQAEVLLWVAQGKRNPEIATILGLAPKTVQKHLEFIFNRLEVESRTAAARRALEVLNSGLG